MPYDIDKLTNLHDIGYKSPEDSAEQIPYILTGEIFDQYLDKRFYDIDVAFRKWMEERAEDPLWQRHATYRRLGSREVFEHLFGYKPTPEDTSLRMALARILSYYCTRKIRSTRLDYKPRMHIYQLPMDLKRKPPYSIRLLIEQAEAEGRILTKRDVTPRREKKWGEADRKLTQQRMDERSRKAKELWNERYKDRNAKHRQKKRDHSSGDDSQTVQSDQDT